jgi:hypothetical protein
MASDFNGERKLAVAAVVTDELVCVAAEALTIEGIQAVDEPCRRTEESDSVEGGGLTSWIARLE